MRETETIWMNGEFIDWADAKVHVGAHGLHYGTGVFEGIRCYETADGPAVFRLREHLKRLENSARLLYMDLPYTAEDLRTATHELIGRNGLPECYLRPFAFYGYGELGVHTKGNPVEVVIMSWPWANYLGDDNQTIGIRAMVSSWKRIGANTIPHVAKATGVYLNSMLAVHEAQRSGYDEAILLTDEGFVADGSGENVFVVKDGRIWTPPLSTSILPGITRDSVIQIAQDLGYVVEEANLIRSDLYLADEIFMTGTAAEVTPVRSVDDHEVGAGPVTLEIAEGLPRNRARQERALGALARPRRGRQQDARRGVKAATDSIPLSLPFLDERDEELVLEVLRSGRLSLGPAIDRFEELFAEQVGAPYAAAVSAGTAGLHLLCRIAGVGEGDEVITSPYSFVASANCFIYEGATPVFADVDERTLNLDPAAVEAAITERTRAIVAVDIFGYPVRARRAAGALRAARPRARPGCVRGARGEVQGRAGRLPRRRRGLRVLSEQADDDRRGRHGHRPIPRRCDSCSSACGTRGAPTAAGGSSTRGSASTTGSTTFARRSGSASSRSSRRSWRSAARRRRATGSCWQTWTGSTPPLADDAEHVRSWFVYVVTLDRGVDREAVIAELGRQGIATSRYLPSIHLQSYMRERYGFREGLCPVSEDLAQRTLALPFFTALEAGDQERSRAGTPHRARVGRGRAQASARAHGTRGERARRERLVLIQHKPLSARELTEL